MAKYLLTDAEVLIDGHDLSNWCFSLDTPDSTDQVDISGFKADRVKETLPGQRDQTITLGVLQDFQDNGPHDVLETLYENGTSFEVWIKPNASASTSATNPVFGGEGILYEYNGLSGELNARGETTVTIKPNALAFGWQSYDPS